MKLKKTLWVIKSDNEIIKEEISENCEVLYRGKFPSRIINNFLVTSKFVLNYIKNINNLSKMENYFEKI